ncbi:hypothetical protein LMH87_001068 [Akanthomyces muscarius]|uniref:Uncharacterized protein n=1 Tax=Akanthomyces muscarius TaxID=2231603 RepID=A0A9W8UN60_AKAMU|nr:hypothetical protein LMH87_001068 [Akanthomyces muscarius]KAJ4155842.1 hypothetical protein LMH87_001068 [Akanthomyces muscarius]
MQYLTLIPLLLAPLASAAPAAAGDVRIYDSRDYRGQQRQIPVSGVCVNLSPPFSTSGRGIQSIRFATLEGENCEIHHAYNCKNEPSVVVFESQPRTRIIAGSIRCSKNTVDG